MWTAEALPRKMASAQLRLRKLNPTYRHRLFSAAHAEAFVREHFSRRVFRAYQAVRPLAFKADLWRLCVLYVHGGVYCDAGHYYYATFDDFLDADVDLVTVAGGCRSTVFNTFLAASPRHPFLKRTIDLAVNNITRRSYDGGPLGITGPVVYGIALRGQLGLPAGAANLLPGVHTEKNGRRIKLLYDRWTTYEDAALHDPVTHRRLCRVRYEGYLADKAKQGIEAANYGALYRMRQVYEDD